MTTDVIIDLHADFAAACAKELIAAGYAMPTGPAAEIIRSYANVRHRRVPQRPRKVHMASYTVPADLIAGEQSFLVAAARGADLRPYGPRSQKFCRAALGRQGAKARWSFAIAPISGFVAKRS